MSIFQSSEDGLSPEHKAACGHRGEPSQIGTESDPRDETKGQVNDGELSGGGGVHIPFASALSATAKWVGQESSASSGPLHRPAYRGVIGGVACSGTTGGAGGIGGGDGIYDADPYATLAIHGGLEPDPTSGSILTPIVQSTTYVQQRVGVHKGHTYSRASNPTVEALERALGTLEGCLPAVAFNTGMSAITALFLATLRAGDHVVVSDCVYGGTVRLLNVVLAPLGVRASFVNTADPAAVDAAITPSTKLVFIETPANPTLKLTDVAAIAAVARSRGVLLAVDNTFLTPVLLRPLDLGADVAVYSTTKYIEGHNATVGGTLTTRDAGLADRFKLYRKTLGSIQAPFEAWLTLRGLKTLPLRIRQHCRNAQVVAQYLDAHPFVTKVYYPGLASFPQATLAARQHQNDGRGAFHGGIVSFEVRGGVAAGIEVMNSVRLCSLAENLGSVETLITHPVSMTHGDVPPDQRLSAGITDGLIRLSVGLEDPLDIIADLKQALQKAKSSCDDQTAPDLDSTGKESRKGADLRVPLQTSRPVSDTWASASSVPRGDVRRTDCGSISEVSQDVSRGPLNGANATAGGVR